MPYLISFFLFFVLIFICSCEEQSQGKNSYGRSHEKQNGYPDEVSVTKVLRKQSLGVSRQNNFLQTNQRLVGSNSHHHSPKRNISAGRRDKSYSRNYGVSPCHARSGSGIVLMYHRFGEPYKSTSVTVEQFEQQLKYFKEHNYKVVSLSQLVQALKDGIFFRKWVALTIDDAYRSFLRVKSILENYQYPYTLFVSTQNIGHGSYLNWTELKEISQSSLGELGAHSHSHDRLIRLPKAQRREDILLSAKIIYQNTGKMPVFFAYPYGEASLALIDEVQNMQWEASGQYFRFQAAFSTQSGPVGCSSHLFSLPRFAINENYGNVDSLFKDKMKSRHVPILNYSPKNKAICIEDRWDSLSLVSDMDLSRLTCYSNQSGGVTTQYHDGIVRINLSHPIDSVGVPVRVNCTMWDESGRFFYWYGRELSVLSHSSECTQQ